MPTSMEAQKNPQKEDEIKGQEAKNNPRDEAKNLLEWAKDGKWEKVVERYGSNPSSHKVRITRSKDTALHIAVLDQKEDIVEELVRLIDEAASAAKKQGSALESKEKASVSAAKNEASASAAKEQAKGNASPETPKDHPLKIENERGNTPLHLAASIGNARMCYCIAQMHKDLVGARNKLAETPLFLAALHGNKDAFLCLHNICGVDEGYKYCRKNNGETILHCAIAGEYFDLAYQIIEKYSKLANSVNEEGLAPLHLLANKPAVFRSGSQLRFFNKIIYLCMYVKKLEVSKEESPPLGIATSNGKKVDEKYPENYQTCMNFLYVLTGMWSMLTSTGKKENSGGQTTSQNQATSRENSQKSGNQVKPNKHDPEDPVQRNASASQNQGNEAVDEDQVLWPPNYHTCVEFVKFICQAMMVVLGIGSREIKKIQAMKEKHIWSDQIMKKLLKCASTYEYDYLAGSEPQRQSNEEDITAALREGNEQKSQKDQKTDGKTLIFNMKDRESVFDVDSSKEKDQKTNGKRLTVNIRDKGCVFDVDFSKGEVTLATVEGNKQKGEKETPILIAAKNGITELVMEILERSPVAIHDMNSASKNILMLAVENRQPEVYNYLLLKKKSLMENLLHAVDDEGNNALHLAAMATHHQPWLIPGAALQMQWEIKWYKYVEHSMPMHFSMRYNKANKTAKEIFTEKHEELVKKGSEWLNQTSNSCSVVAALIATVAFATSATVPGGIREGKGTPTLEHKPAFNVFSIASLIALCSSVNSLVMFLAILTSRHQERDFGSNLPNKLLFGLSSLFISIAAILASFCAGHFFVLEDELKYAAIPIYAVTCLPVAFFGMMQLPLYLDLIWATFRKVSKRSSTAVS